MFCLLASKTQCMGCKAFFLCLETKELLYFSSFLLWRKFWQKLLDKEQRRYWLYGLAITVFMPQIKNIGNLNNTDNTTDVETSNGTQKVSRAGTANRWDWNYSINKNEATQKILNASSTDYTRRKYLLNNDIILLRLTAK